MVDEIIDVQQLLGAQAQVVKFMHVVQAAGGAGDRQKEVFRNGCLPGFRQQIARCHQFHPAAAGVALNPQNGLPCHQRIEFNAIAVRAAGAGGIHTGRQTRCVDDIAITAGATAGTPQRHVIDHPAANTALAPLGSDGKIAIFVQPDPQPSAGKTGIAVITLGVTQSTAKAAGARCHRRIGQHDSHTVGTGAPIGVVIEFQHHIIVFTGNQPLQGRRRGLVVHRLGHAQAIADDLGLETATGDTGGPVGIEAGAVETVAEAGDGDFVGNAYLATPAAATGLAKAE